MASQFAEEAQRLQLHKIIFKSTVNAIFLAQSFLWSDAMVKVVEEAFPLAEDSAAMAFVAAAFGTVASVVFVWVVFRASRLLNDYAPRIEIERNP